MAELADRVCDWCGDEVDEEVLATELDCSRPSCGRRIYHQCCLEDHLRKAKCSSSRLSGYPCPRGHGKKSKFQEDPCLGKIEVTHRKIAKKKAKLKAAQVYVPSPRPPPPSKQAKLKAAPVPATAARQPVPAAPKPTPHPLSQPRKQPQQPQPAKPTAAPRGTAAPVHGRAAPAATATPAEKSKAEMLAMVASIRRQISGGTPNAGGAGDRFSSVQAQAQVAQANSKGTPPVQALAERTAAPAAKPPTIQIVHKRTQPSSHLGLSVAPVVPEASPADQGWAPLPFPAQRASSQHLASSAGTLSEAADTELHSAGDSSDGNLEDVAPQAPPNPFDTDAFPSLSRADTAPPAPEWSEHRHAAPAAQRTAVDFWSLSAGGQYKEHGDGFVTDLARYNALLGIGTSLSGDLITDEREIEGEGELLRGEGGCRGWDACAGSIDSTAAGPTPAGAAGMPWPENLHPGPPAPENLQAGAPWPENLQAGGEPPAAGVFWPEHFHAGVHRHENLQALDGQQHAAGELTDEAVISAYLNGVELSQLPASFAPLLEHLRSEFGDPSAWEGLRALVGPPPAPPLPASRPVEPQAQASPSPVLSSPIDTRVQRPAGPQVGPSPEPQAQLGPPPVLPLPASQPVAVQAQPSPPQWTPASMDNHLASQQQQHAKQGAGARGQGLGGGPSPVPQAQLAPLPVLTATMEPHLASQQQQRLPSPSPGLINSASRGLGVPPHLCGDTRGVPAGVDTSGGHHSAADGVGSVGGGGPVLPPMGTAWETATEGEASVGECVDEDLFDDLLSLCLGPGVAT